LKEELTEEEEQQYGNYIRCFGCNVLIPRSRIEYHHIYGRKYEKVAPLCNSCHDIVDRTPLGEWPTELFTQTWEEIRSLPEGRQFRHLRLFIFKMAKLRVKVDDKELEFVK
jgi:hypothetical protein